jgi:hypothetical protein
MLQIAKATTWTGQHGHAEQHGQKKQYALFMEFELHWTMDQVS